MEYIKEFKDLLDNPQWENEFVGYGNPNAKILIVGKEAALKQGSTGWENFYKPNHAQWKDTIKNNLTWKHWDGKSEYKFPEFFNPQYPFYKQPFKCNGKNGTSATWYWYQRLMDNIITPKETGERYIDFFENAFITELNGQTRLNSKSEKQNVKLNIRHRFDLMRASAPFWKHFKIVILACGRYADALKENENLRKEIFGDAHTFFTGQLSMNKAKENVQNITEEIRKLDIEKILNS